MRVCVMTYHYDNSDRPATNGFNAWGTDNCQGPDIHIYIYIYIEREREKAIDVDTDIDMYYTYM